jgi:hypothetical protein
LGKSMEEVSAAIVSDCADTLSENRIQANVVAINFILLELRLSLIYIPPVFDQGQPSVCSIPQE